MQLKECQTRYHIDYNIQKSQRTYYGGVPDVIQVAQHFFIESSLLELFVAGQVFGWFVFCLLKYTTSSFSSDFDGQDLRD